ARDHRPRTAHRPAHDAHRAGDSGRAAGARHPGRHQLRSARRPPAAAAGDLRRRRRHARRRPRGAAGVTGATALARFHSLAHLSGGEIRALLALARRLERQPEPRALAGRILGLLFFNPSLRTLASMQSAMARLGGSSIVLQPGQGTWKLETRPGVVMDAEAAEHVREAIPVLAGYVDALGIRAFAGGTDLAADLADRDFAEM